MSDYAADPLTGVRVEDYSNGGFAATGGCAASPASFFQMAPIATTSTYSQNHATVDFYAPGDPGIYGATTGPDARFSGFVGQQTIQEIRYAGSASWQNTGPSSWYIGVELNNGNETADPNATLAQIMGCNAGNPSGSCFGPGV